MFSIPMYLSLLSVGFLARMGKENDLISTSLAAEFFETEVPSVNLEKLRIELLDFIQQHPSSPVALVTVIGCLCESLVEQRYHLKRTLSDSWITSAVVIEVRLPTHETKALPAWNSFLGKAMQWYSYLDSTQCNRSSGDCQLSLSSSTLMARVREIWFFFLLVPKCCLTAVLLMKFSWLVRLFAGSRWDLL